MHLVHRRVAAWLAVLAVALGALLAPSGRVLVGHAAAPPATTNVVSRFDGSSGSASDQGGFSPSVSADGRFVAFESAGLLTGDQTGGHNNVYVRDRQLSRTILVSRADGANGAPGNNDSDAPSISADGRYVAFESRATNLVPGFVPQDRFNVYCGEAGNDRIGDVFLRDIVNNTTTLISHTPGSTTTPGNHYSEDPVISADGTTVAFDSAATDLTPVPPQPDRGCTPQGFANKVATTVTQMILTNNPADPIPNDLLDALAISGNGDVVAFVSEGTNVTSDTTTPGEVYARTLSTQTTVLVSRATGDAGAPADEGSGGVTVNHDGSLIAFNTEATNLGTTPPDCPNALKCGEVWVRKTTSPATTTLVSQTTAGAIGDGDSGPARISDNGAFVAFETAAPNLGGSLNPNGSELVQVAVRDLGAGTTTIVSRASGDNGALGDAQSSDPAISADGLSVAFESSAQNLTRADTRNADQVYLRGTALEPDPLPVSASAKTGGYDLVSADGVVYPFGATGYGSLGGSRALARAGDRTDAGESHTRHAAQQARRATVTRSFALNKPMVGMATVPAGGGYWLVAADGGIFPFGPGAGGYGSTGGMRLNKPIVGMASTPTGRGYWLVASDGGIFPFGDAVGYGSLGNVRLNKPIVGMAAVPGGGGYWLVASDGGIFPFGPSAVGYGSLGNVRLNQPVVGMAAASNGGGYWLVAADGGIFPFGPRAGGFGSTGNIRLNKPIVGMAGTRASGGYWLVAADGGIFPFGDAPGLGSLGNHPPAQPIVGMAPGT